MRLLQLQGDSGIQLVKSADNAIPPYAILSHTWGADEDEVTFKDLNKGTGTTKAGYRKLEFCRRQAASDHLDYFWVDTCCINKDSSTELSEAIVSMFRWYQNAAQCFVYLDDVSTDSKDGKTPQQSKWFTRGWTLQELLAPKSVKFFSREGHLLFTKSSKVLEIANITHIPAEALQQRGPLSRYSVEERMSWAKERNTTRSEDVAYCLMGVFDIHMVPIYGEGKDKAIKRLQKAIREAEDESASPIENAKKWLESAKTDKNVQELFRKMFIENEGLGEQEDDVDLQSDIFKTVLQAPTVLAETSEHVRLLMGNSKKEGPPDLIAVKRTATFNRSAVAHVLSGTSNYRDFDLIIATPARETMTTQMDFTLTDWDDDGSLDLVMIKKNYTGTNSTEVHITSGKSNYQHWMLEVGTILHETDETFTFAMGKRDANSRPDLFAIKKSRTTSRTTEVHILSGASHFKNFIIRTDTALHETDDTWDFLVTDWNGDGHQDLVAIKKSNSSDKCTSVHVLSGASIYKEFILRAETPLYRSYSMFEFAVADWTKNGKPDLIAVAKDTESNSTEVHVMTQQG
ncbi:hypothetical protein HBH98_011560 [Parastagonospora nodorum]|nr:hypothetical protein HBH51_076260 [Parastagonospora nodorum]KAH3982237.1 hypothetical protein HBH52_078150 [Parastagonospora nodorum]KAH4069128.1 hypothetical protein HBH50_109160 [Parastagonospora nodorum]KAH4088197.1 hypothetical protein HBH48_126130 [Parastagonospora nodorum]KAH4103651.1 hypothetical protein HBH46_112560 [Parastagonospora nodorum]